MTQIVQLILCIIIGYTIGKVTGDKKKGYIWGGILLVISILYIIMH